MCMIIIMRDWSTGYPQWMWHVLPEISLWQGKTSLCWLYSAVVYKPSVTTWCCSYPQSDSICYYYIPKRTNTFSCYIYSVDLSPLYIYIYMFAIHFEDQSWIPIVFEYQPRSRTITLRNEGSFDCFTFLLIKVGMIPIC